MNEDKQHTSKKRIVIILSFLLFVIIVVIAVALLFVLKPNSEKNKVSHQEAPNACALFTESDAKKIIGAETKRQSTDDNQNSNLLGGNNLKDKPKIKTVITTCVYSRNGQLPVSQSAPTNQVKPGPPAPEVKTEADITNNASATPVETPQTSEASGDSNNKDNLITIIVRSSSKEQAAREYETTKPSAKDIKNLGDKAFWKVETSKSGTKDGLLSVLKGKILVSIAVNESEEALATKIAASIEAKL